MVLLGEFQPQFGSSKRQGLTGLKLVSFFQVNEAIGQSG